MQHWGIFDAAICHLDGAVVYKSYQVSFSHDVVVGGAYTNHYFSIDEVKGEGLKIFLQECMDGLNGKLASYIKVCIISFQNNPQGMCLYFALVGLPQTIN